MSAPHPDAERLTLAALPAEQADPEVAAHLRQCAQCRAEVDAAAPYRRAGACRGVGEPLPIPPTRVWQAILDELADEAAGAGARSATGRSATTGGRRGGRWARPRAGTGRRRPQRV